MTNCRLCIFYHYFKNEDRKNKTELNYVQRIKENMLTTKQIGELKREIGTVILELEGKIIKLKIREMGSTADLRQQKKGPNNSTGDQSEEQKEKNVKKNEQSFRNL